MFSILANFCVLFSSSLLRGKGISQNRQRLFRIKPAVLLISALLIFRGPLLSLAHLSEMASNLLCSQEYLQLLILLLLPPRVLPDTVPFILLIRLIIPPTHIHTLPPHFCNPENNKQKQTFHLVFSFLLSSFLPGFDHAFIIYQVSIISQVLTPAPRELTYDTNWSCGGALSTDSKL